MPFPIKFATEAPTNKTRAQWALESLEVFASSTSSIDNLNKEPDEVLTDLLCDLEHWANQNDISFDDCVAHGKAHFDAEIEGEKEAVGWDLY